MDLPEKKALLRSKEEEIKFLEERMTIVQNEFSHWKTRLNVCKRRTKFGEFACQISKVFREDMTQSQLFLTDLKESNKKLQRKLNDKIQMKLIRIKELIANRIEVYEELREYIKQGENTKVQLNLQIFERENQLKGIELLMMNPYRFYGKEMETLKKILDENSNEFIKPPKGPLGTLFTVKLGNWVPLVEHVLDKYLFIFLVDNRHDADRLEEYISQIYGKYPATGFPENLEFLTTDVNPMPRRPEVWIGNFAVKAKDFSKTAVVGSNYITLKDMLEIQDNDPIVWNVIGEFSNFEKILLFNNEHEAFGELSNYKKIPKNCIAGYTKEFYKVIPKPSFGTVKMDRKSTNGLLLKPSTKNIVSHLKSEIETLTKERDEKVEKKLQANRKTQLEFVLEVEKMDKECKKLKAQLTKVQKISKYISTMLDEIFTSNPSPMAKFIIKADIHEVYFNKARESAVAMAIIANKKSKLERIIGKISIDIAKSEKKLREATFLV